MWLIANPCGEQAYNMKRGDRILATTGNKDRQYLKTVIADGSNFTCVEYALDSSYF